LRLQELEGRPVTKYIRFALPFQSAREINAAEENAPWGVDLKLTPDGLQIFLKPYQPRTIALRFRKSINKNDAAKAAMNRALNLGQPVTGVPVELPFNVDGVSTDANRADGDFDGKGQTLAGELLPATLSLEGVPFKFGSTTDGALNVLVPARQTL